jgi:hypothetical protein
MGENNARIYNIISLVFLVLTVGLLIFFTIQFASPAPEEDESFSAADLPTTIPPTATFTPTVTSTATVPPSFTPTPSNTPTPTLSATPTPTTSPSPTITATLGPTETPSVTPTPSASVTPLPSQTSEFPTETRTPTLSPFFFELRTQPQFVQNQNSVGCAFQAVAGTVLGLDGLETTQQFRIRVIGPQFDQVQQTGTASAYGATAGFEIPVAQQIIAQEYVVRLESLAGTPLTDSISVQFPGDCLQNIAILTFVQTRQLGGGAG